jgi:hypothetical protein
MARASSSVAKLAKPGNFSGIINLLESQSGIVGLGTPGPFGQARPGVAGRLEAIKAGNAGMTRNARTPINSMVPGDESRSRDAAGDKAINTSLY